MNIEDHFEFINSKLWLNFTHEKYLSEEEARYKIEHEKTPEKWNEIWQRFVQHRKLGAVPLFIETINKKFWYFPTDSIQKKISDIETLGTKLFDKISSDQQFNKSFLVDAEVEEAISSAIYEGANTTRAKAKQLIASRKRPATKADWMLLNNMQALEWIKKNKLKPLSADLILDIHQIVTKNTLEGPDENYSGKFRDDKVFVHNSKNQVVHEGIDFHQIEKALNEVITHVSHHPRFIHPLIRGILLHYFIAYLHPFFDGNGRTARTLFYFKALKHDLKFVELLSISAHLKNAGNQYEKSFVKVKDNDWDITYFIDYCLESLLAALKIVQSKVDYLIKINNLKEVYPLNDNQVGLLQRMALQRDQLVTIEDYAAEINRSREIARQDLKNLVELSLCLETKQSKKNLYQVDAEKLKELVLKLSK